MESEKWPAFITGFVLGMLVTLGVVGTFGWQKYQQARAATEEARERAAVMEEQARAEAEKARRAAEFAERVYRELKKELLEERKKAKLEQE
jgi:predicted negative regulator of RcsB-dependent stress response